MTKVKQCRGCKEELELYMFRFIGGVTQNDSISKRCIICDGSYKKLKNNVLLGPVTQECKEWVKSVEKRAGYIDPWEVFLLLHYVESFLHMRNSTLHQDIEIYIMWNKLREAVNYDNLPEDVKKEYEFRWSRVNSERKAQKVFKSKVESIDKEFKKEFKKEKYIPLTEEEKKQRAKESKKKYYQKNREEISNKNKEKYREKKKNNKLSNLTEEELKEYKKEYHRKWREKNRELVNGYWRDYYERNKEEVQERQKKWREENKEQIKDTSNRYLKKLKEKNPNYYKEYYEKNKERILEQARERYRKKRDLEN